MFDVRHIQFRVCCRVPRSHITITLRRFAQVPQSHSYSYSNEKPCVSNLWPPPAECFGTHYMSHRRYHKRAIDRALGGCVCMMYTICIYIYVYEGGWTSFQFINSEINSFHWPVLCVWFVCVCSTRLSVIARVHHTYVNRISLLACWHTFACAKCIYYIHILHTYLHLSYPPVCVLMPVFLDIHILSGRHQNHRQIAAGSGQPAESLPRGGHHEAAGSSAHYKTVPGKRTHMCVRIVYCKCVLSAQLMASS